MPDYKICVYAISKNEEQFVDRWMDAVSEADLVIVTDTGSTDNTVEKLRARGALVYEETISPWRFDIARNTAMDHIPEDVDICVSNDLDEVFEPGWRHTLEQAWTDSCTRAHYWFVWSYHPDGSPDKRFGMEKIHARHGFRWIHPVHEVLDYTGPLHDHTVFINDLVLRHYPDLAKPRSQYLPLLELSASENPDDDRTAFWLGREYVFNKEYEKAIETMTKHLDMPAAVWPPERSASMRYIAQSWLKLGDSAQAKAWYFRAAAECMECREPWLELAGLAYEQQDWELTFFAAERGLAITDRPDHYLSDPAAWGAALPDFAALACHNLGMHERAYAYGEQALALAPDDQRLKQNLEYYQAALGGSKRVKKYKVCVYAISKNEEQFVNRWMDSMQEADMVIVTDTGSEDKTVDKLKERGAVVYTEEVNPWRFDTARNRSLDHVPQDADICVCTDLDECFEPGWREKLEAAWRPDTTMGNYIFNWSLKEDGTPDTQFIYFKAHSRKDYKWSFPIHECLTYTGAGDEQKVFIPGMVLNHYPDQTKSRGSYLPLLELAAAEDPASDRMTYYLGREYMYAGQWQKCIDTLTRYLALPAARWKEERCAAMRWIAHCSYQLGNLTETYAWYYRAIAEVPGMRDAYVECARIAYANEDWTTVYFMTSQALNISDKSDVYVNMGYAWDHTPDDLAAIACYHLGLYDKALMHARKALDFAPSDERLKDNIKLIEAKCNNL